MRQKKGTILLGLGVVLLLFVTGCGDKVDEVSKASPFLGGDKGLEMGFLDDSPPDEITNINFPFQVIVSLRNVGEHDITKDQVRVDLTGILVSDFGTNLVTKDIKPEEDVIKSREKSPDGDVIEATETFATIPRTGNFQLGSDKITGNTKFTFRANVCYQYQTDAIASICVLENMIDIADDAICSPKGSRPISSSGSPLKITAFRQSVAGQNKIQFSFDIGHFGTGSVFEHKTIAADAGCPKDPSGRRTEENRVKVTVNTGITNTLNCPSLGSGTGTVAKTIRLVKGKRTITCTQELPATDFERNVDIKLEFNYLDSVTKEVLAKRLEGVGGVGSPSTTTTGPQTCGGQIGSFSQTYCKNTNSGTASCSDYGSTCSAISSSTCTCTSGFTQCAGTCANSPIGSGAIQCGGVIGGVQTYCRSTSSGSTGTCSDYGTDCGTVASNLCTCGSGLTQCGGTCADSPIGVGSGAGGTSPPEIGSIQPQIAVLGKSQTFVVRDVYDPQSGITSCNLVVDNSNLNELSIGHNGPIECKDVNPKQCDFHRGVNILDETKTGDPKDFALTPFELKAVCTNGETPGVPFERKQVINPKAEIPQSEWPPVVSGDNTGPEIGTLVTNVALRDVDQLFLVTGLQDPSGIESCEILKPSGIIPTGLMTIEGPLPCMGEAKNAEIGGFESRHGSCTGKLLHKYTSQPKRNSALEIIEVATGSGSISLTIKCTDRKNNPTTKQVEVVFI